MLDPVLNGDEPANGRDHPAGTRDEPVLGPEGAGDFPPLADGAFIGTGPPAAPPGSSARQHYGLAAGALILLALIWGYTWPLMKSVLTYADPFVYAGMRTFIAGVVLVAMLPLFRRPMRPKAIGLTALLGVLQTAGFLGLMTWALHGEGAGKTAILKIGRAHV